MKRIHIGMVIFLLCCVFVLGAGQLGDDEENQTGPAPPLGAQEAEENILDRTCGFWNPCPEEYACFTFDELGRRCAKPDPCSYFQCKDDKICQEKEPIIPGGITKVKCLEPEAYCIQFHQMNSCNAQDYCEWKENRCIPKQTQNPDSCFEVWELKNNKCKFKECGPEADNIHYFQTKELCEQNIVCEGLRRTECKDNPACEWIRTGWFSGRCELKEEPAAAQNQPECGNTVCEEGETAANCPTDCTCTTLWGAVLEHGQSILAYLSSSVPIGEQCVSQTRLCYNGVLSGTYQYPQCQVQSPAPCSLDGVIVQSAQSHTFFDTRVSSNCAAHGQSRLCTNGVLDGSATYQYAHCVAQLPNVSLTINGQSSITLSPGASFTISWSSSNADSCTLTNAQGQTNPTAPNAAGSSQGAAPSAGQTFTYSLSCTNAAGTTTKSASVSGAAIDPNRGACTYKGQKYPESATLDLTASPGIAVPLRCDNKVWVYREYGIYVCDDVKVIYSDATLANDLGCRQPPILIVADLRIQWRHGKAPYTLNVTTHPGWAYGGTYCAEYQPCIYTLSWGDGSSTTITSPSDSWLQKHTYASPGTYTISYTDLKGYSNSGNVRVDP